MPPSRPPTGTVVPVNVVTITTGAVESWLVWRRVLIPIISSAPQRAPAIQNAIQLNLNCCSNGRMVAIVQSPFVVGEGCILPLTSPT